MDRVDRLVRLMGSPAEDSELARLTLDAANAVAEIPPQELAPHVPRLVAALRNWFSVTGGDAAVDRVARVLAQIDSTRIVAAFEDATAALTEEARDGYFNELAPLAVACPALLPVLDRRARPSTGAYAPDTAFEDDVALFRPYVKELIAACADYAELGSVGAYIAAVRARLLSQGTIHLHHFETLHWAMLGLVTSNELNALVSRFESASPLPPNWEIRNFFHVFAFKRLVEVVTDPANEIDSATLSERGAYPDEFEIGAEVGFEEEARTRALKVATLRALGMSAR